MVLAKVVRNSPVMRDSSVPLATKRLLRSRRDGADSSIGVGTGPSALGLANASSGGPGRGSAAGSLVAYLIGITQLDPLPHQLLFERFLNPERTELPDIDTDFCVERRGEVIQYCREKYGNDRVAQIVTFNRMKARAALRDVGRDGPVLQVGRPAVEGFSYAPLVDDLFGERAGRDAAVIEGDQVRHLGLLHRPHHLLALGRVHGQRLLADHHLPRPRGGNRDLAGWRAIRYEGDVQPRGYTDEEVTGRD